MNQLVGVIKFNFLTEIYLLKALYSLFSAKNAIKSHLINLY